MTKSIKRALRVLLTLAVVLVIIDLSLWAVRRYATRLQMAKVGYVGDPGAFPAAAFRDRLRADMVVDDVLREMTSSHYDRIDYFLAPVAAGPDTVLVQRFVYSIPWLDDLHVNVLYTKQRTYDVEYDDAYLRDVTPISEPVARDRLTLGASQRAN